MEKGVREDAEDDYESGSESETGHNDFIVNNEAENNAEKGSKEQSDSDTFSFEDTARSNSDAYSILQDKAMPSLDETFNTNESSQSSSSDDCSDEYNEGEERA